MDYYPNVIDVYLNKKTVKPYATLKEFHDDLASLGFKFTYGMVGTKYIFGKLNDVDFTFLLNKLLDEKEYSEAVFVLMVDGRQIDKATQDRFQNTSLHNVQVSAWGMFYSKFIECPAPESKGISFSCMLTDSPIFDYNKEKDVDMRVYFWKLGKIVDLSVIYYGYNRENDGEEFSNIFAKTTESNRRWICSMLLTNNCIHDLQTLQLVSLHKDLSDHEETKLFDAAFEKHFKIVDMKTQVKELAQQIELIGKLTE